MARFLTINRFKKSQQIIVVFFGINFSAYSQENAIIVTNQQPVSSGKVEMAQELPVDGTYQIIIKNGTESYEIDIKFLFLVNEKRNEKDFVIIEIDENTSLKIAPYNVINSSEFIPLTKYVFE